MAKKKSAAPSGLSISRDGLKFTISWKIPAKNMRMGSGYGIVYIQKRWCLQMGLDKMEKIDVGKSATKKR